MQSNELPINECYRVLEISPGDSFAKAKKNYKKLIQQNHPDRFQAHSRAAIRAEEQLLQVIKAYRQIKQYSDLYGAMPLEKAYAFDIDEFQAEIEKETVFETESGASKSAAEALLARASTLTQNKVDISEEEEDSNRVLIRPKFLLFGIIILCGLAGFVAKMSPNPDPSPFLGNKELTTPEPINDNQAAQLEEKNE